MPSGMLEVLFLAADDATVGCLRTTAIVHNLGGKRRTSYSCYGFSTSTIKSYIE